MKAGDRDHQTSALSFWQSEIGRALRSHRAALISVAVFSAVINLLLLVPAVYMLQVYDRVLSSANVWTLFMLSGLAVGLYVLMGLLEWLRSMVMIHMGDSLDQQLSSRLYQVNLRHQLTTGGLAGSPDGKVGMEDLNQVRQYISSNGLFALFDAPWLPIYLGVMFLFHPVLGWVAMIGAALLALLSVIGEYWSRHALAQSGRLAGQASSMANAHWQGAETVTALSMQDNLASRWSSLHRQYIRYQALASARTGQLSAISKALRIGLQSAMLCVGALLAIQQDISAGMMVAGSILIGRMLAPLDQLIGNWKQWTTTRLAIKKLNLLFQHYPPHHNSMVLPRPQGHLQLHSVTLVAPGAKQPCLSGLSLSVQPGEVVGVIGGSGAGKSSLAKLLVGIWQPRLGKVTLDHAELSQYGEQNLGHYIGYLAQDVSLFAGTISDNIARFSVASSPCEQAKRNESVIEAAKLAGVHEMIVALPQGYDTPLGDGGAGLSGGQKQRIGLARAVYGQPCVLVLDEPNAHLDDLAEKALASTLSTLKEKGITVVLITHRAAVLAHTDKILVLNKGRQQAFGPSKEVLAAMQKAKIKPVSQPLSNQSQTLASGVSQFAMNTSAQNTLNVNQGTRS